jgi:PGF-pre-PGF domain-containing protein
MYVNITGNTNMGVITTSTELLKNTSTFVNNPPGGLVYKNINIWVGTAGVATPKNIKEAFIKFRVDNTWMSSNGVKGSDIALVKWNGTDWIQLETQELLRDDAYSYFQGKTTAFSPFAITTYVAGAKSSLTFSDQEVPIESGGIVLGNDGKPIQPAQTANTTQVAPSGTSTWSIILILFILAISGVAIYFWRLK